MNCPVTAGFHRGLLKALVRIDHRRLQGRLNALLPRGQFLLRTLHAGQMRAYRPLKATQFAFGLGPDRCKDQILRRHQ